MILVGVLLYEPRMDHPYLIPSAGDARPDWQIDDLIRAVEKSEKERISVLQFHGVPDTAHNWVSSSPDKFEGICDTLLLISLRLSHSVT